MRYSRCMYRSLLNVITAAELVSMDYALQSSGSSLHAKGRGISKGGEFPPTSGVQLSFLTALPTLPIYIFILRSLLARRISPSLHLQTYRLSHVLTHRFACSLFVLKKSCVFRFLTTMMDCFLKGGFQRVLVALMLLLTYSCAAGRRAIFRAGT